MRMLWFAGVLLVALSLTGCNRSPQVDTTDDYLHLGTETDITLSAWLLEPRADQAEQVHRLHDAVKTHQASLRANPDANYLLPRLCAPQGPPVLQEVRFSEKLGVSETLNPP